jgi:2-polyprenyl-6-methoxyphenol hydroxylase-like FAD-dependent oxidoreductase
VRPRIIEMALKPHNQTRATEIQPAVLEVLHRSGLADKFLESSIPMKGLRVLDRNMEEAFVSLIPPAESPYPHTRSIPQWRTEQILADRLTAVDVEVERGVTAREIMTSENGVQVESVDKEGRPSIIHADYLVGAGGAHSPVRGAFHMSLDGITYPREYLVADVTTKGVHREGNLIAVAISETGMVMTIELPNGRSLVLTDLPDKMTLDATPGLDDVRTAIAAHLSRPFEVFRSALGLDVSHAPTDVSQVFERPVFSGGRCRAHLQSPRRRRIECRDIGWGEPGLDASRGAPSRGERHTAGRV